MKVLLVAMVLITGALSVGAHAAESSTTIWFSRNTDIAEAAGMIERGEFAAGAEKTKRVMGEVDLHPYDIAAGYNNLCVANLGFKLFRQAIETCGRALRIKPSMWQAHNNLGNAYFGLAQFDEAIRNYHKAMGLRPDLEMLEFNLFLALNYKQRGAAPLSLERDG